jgi:hypothetical protein
MIAILFSLLLFTSSNEVVNESFNQCDLELPTGVWQSETTHGEEGKNASAEVTISINGMNVDLSDFTGGLFEKYGQDAVPVTLIFNCDGTIETQTLQTYFGEAKITSGTWNTVNNTILLNWELTENNIVQTTQLTYQP